MHDLNYFSAAAAKNAREKFIFQMLSAALFMPLVYGLCRILTLCIFRQTNSALFQNALHSPKCITSHKNSRCFCTSPRGQREGERIVHLGQLSEVGNTPCAVGFVLEGSEELLSCSLETCQEVWMLPFCITFSPLRYTVHLPNGNDRKVTATNTLFIHYMNKILYFTEGLYTIK